MSNSYRSTLEDLARIEHYETEVFSLGSYASLLRTIERWYLENFLQHAPFSASGAEYLGFACGAGRVLSLMESKVARARGVDVSAAMLGLAERKISRAELIRADIAAAGTPVEGQYDLITAFRFFLNAEPSLRLSAIQSLALRLKDGYSGLIFNIHADLPSQKSLLKARQWLQKPAQVKERSRITLRLKGR